MTVFKPPISERETEELIEIAHSSTEIWNQEAINQSKTELRKRNISLSEQNEVLAKWKSEYKIYAKKLKKEEKLGLESNEIESYKIYEMILIFLFGPLIFIRPSRSMTVFQLKKENFKLKFKQRIIILSLSFISWFLYGNYEYRKSEQKRLEEIQKVDISDWEKKFGYDKK